ncbi:MAG: VanZ family protein [Pseudomonadota bacterium]
MVNIKCKTLLWFWFPILAYAGLIFYLSSLERPPVPFEFWNADKLYHFIEYAVFSFLLVRALRFSFPNIRLPQYTILITTLYGISDEVHQFFVPGRYFSIVDMVFDAIGGVLGVYIYYFIIKKLDSETNSE